MQSKSTTHDAPDRAALEAAEADSRAMTARDDGPGLPPELLARLPEGTPLATPEQCRAALVALGLCDGAKPAVTLELYGGMRLKAGCRALPLHAATVGEALGILVTASPKVARMVPAEGNPGAHYRFSLNGVSVTADPAQPLSAGDHLIVFSASVGG